MNTEIKNKPFPPHILLKSERVYLDFDHNRIDRFQHDCVVARESDGTWVTENDWVLGAHPDADEK